MIRLHEDWRWIIRKAWSIRFIIIAFAMSSIEAVLPFFGDLFPRGLFAILTMLSVGGAFVARLVAQQKAGIQNAAD